MRTYFLDNLDKHRTGYVPNYDEFKRYEHVEFEAENDEEALSIAEAWSIEAYKKAEIGVEGRDLVSLGLNSPSFVQCLYEKIGEKSRKVEF